MSSVSAPRIAPKEYVVYPTGYDEATSVDKDKFRLFLYWGERWGWSVRDFSGGQGHAMNRKGEWIYESRAHGGNKYRRFTLEQAEELALKYIDKRTLAGKTLAEWEAHFAKEKV